MTIDYSSYSNVIFLMIDYIGKMLENISEDVNGESSTPDAHHLLDISKYANKLSLADADLLHHL